MKFDKFLSPFGHDKLMEALAKISHVALDMDGTIYLGSTLFPYTQHFLETLRRLGISYSFLTNNPTKSSGDYLEKLRKLGIEATAEQMYTSSIATVDYIHQNYPQAKRIFALGTPSMQEEFRKGGFELCEDSPEDRPDYAHLQPPVPRGMVGVAQVHPLHRHQPRLGMPHRPADHPRGLRLVVQGDRGCHEEATRRGDRQAQPQHVMVHTRQVWP